ncbi:ComEC/Rec2 family competence protein [Nocardioides abyssi]|uniref:ComEC/Rec2 family competence protein n=1 Tax=Nocardioides abyssi TaxID=3058370 RepID=A0ABT8EXD8_9ACTN|nr:ComEC/Rec2 family competence protein [Nocardioides abyssi]MDN4162835.1 ComEC/Rec2 family competence protein [Nocardioides abyssi]
MVDLGAAREVRRADDPEGGDEAERADRVDVRMPLLAVAAWLAGLAAAFLPPAALAAAGAAVVGVAVAVARRRGHTTTVASVVLVALAVGGAAGVRAEQVRTNVVADLAAERAAVTVTGTVVADPRPVEGRFADRVLTRMEVREVTGRGTTTRLRTRVLVLGDQPWADVRLGATVRTRGRLDTAEGGDLAAVVLAGEPTVLAEPGPWWRGADAVRRSIREAVDHRPPAQAALVPALVTGDDQLLATEVEEDFRTTGLTHLLAVSGTNLTLVVGFLLLIARWCGARGRVMYAVGAAGIVGFVLLARTEPSVLRAAVMGSVALLALGVHALQRGFRALGVAVVVLLLVQPGLATSAGFALSVLATAGILVLAPVWRDAMARWLPRWVAEAVAVPLAAQLACTPVVAALSGEVSLVAVAANLVVAPAVGPATVLGLAAGLVGLVWAPAGSLLGTGAGWCVGWIVAVADRGADLPTAAVGWGTGPAALVVLSVGCVLLALGLRRVLARPVPALLVLAGLALAVLVRPPTPGWPTDDWVVAMCDVGQGDALVLRSGPAEAVVVDAGPDPGPVDRCLDDLGVDRVPLVVLTHFHADHVDGLAGVLGGRSVGAVESTSVLDPAGGVAEARAAAAVAGLPVGVAAYGVTRRVGDVTLQTLWPQPGRAATGPEGESANDASVVLLAEVQGVRVLLTGDLEPPGQAALSRALPGLRVDVLKLPHHGSRYQDLTFLVSLGADVVLVSVGEDNDYGHPAEEVLDPLAEAGAEVLRTDEDGDVLVRVTEDGVATRARG